MYIKVSFKRHSSSQIPKYSNKRPPTGKVASRA